MDFSAPINTHFIFNTALTDLDLVIVEISSGTRSDSADGRETERLTSGWDFSRCPSQHPAACTDGDFSLLCEDVLSLLLSLQWIYDGFCMWFLEYSNTLQKPKRSNNSLVFHMCFQCNRQWSVNARSVLRQRSTAGNGAAGSKGRNTVLNAEVFASRPGWPLTRGIITLASSIFMS